MAKNKLIRLSDKDAVAHLWKRCRHMESGDYFFFKKLSWIPKAASFSEKQRVYINGYLEKYGHLEETPKPKKKSELNPHESK